MSTDPPANRDQLMLRLSDLGIATRTTEHAAVFTVGESEELERTLPGGHTKNLFLKDSRGALFLVIAESRTPVDLKALARRIGAGRFSFGKPELLMQHLGVTPGSVTAFAVMNDVEARVSVVIDDRLMRHETINCHPLTNTATTNIARVDLLRFIRATGHEPRTVVLDGEVASRAAPQPADGAIASPADMPHPAPPDPACQR
ncbi:MAG: prolyl-tRNA synthetase associated domain-containing protein [Hyphomicrobiaceae bacterium]|nr:prolyl-tRNA synthetase associated domain-containing protein [Hyphomicrobiaceae bacterium]